MKIKIFISLLVIAILYTNALSQSHNTTPRICQTSEMMKIYYESNPEAKKAADDFETYTQKYIKQHTQKDEKTTCYVFPVVFHIYGTMQGGMSVNDNVVTAAIEDWLNKDFHGENLDFGDVHTSFTGIRGTMPDITFALAQKDPSGNPTTGIIYHPVAAGFANATGYETEIQADAWDNYKYMNVYIMNDLYDDGATNYSGVANYPDQTLSDANLSLVVYNGAYLGENCVGFEDFASVLTHEFGHSMNLIHTFEGECTLPNDNVSDTPPCDFNGTSYGCHPTSTTNSPLNCNSELINAENYMDYSGANGCYKMFTEGQVVRMYAALNHPARQPLWQYSNLVATGLAHLCSGSGINENESLSFDGVYPNPGNDEINLSITSLKASSLIITLSDMTGRIVSQSNHNISQGNNTLQIDITKETNGAYFITVNNQEYSKVARFIKR